VLLQHANDASSPYSSDIAAILEQATGNSPTRTLWVSNVIFAELRPKSFVPGKFKSVDELANYIRSVATVVSPDPNAMLRAARLRNVDWQRPGRMPNEKPRCMTLGDAIHLVSALWVKEACQVNDLEFLTFDNSTGTSVETDPRTKALPILSIEDYTHEIGDDPDVVAVVRLPRLYPALRQQPLDL